VPEKCGFPLQFEIRRYWQLFSEQQRAGLQSILARPQLQVSAVSPSGRFRIHFDTSGANVPALLDGSGARIPGTARAYADSVAAVFDFVRRFEVETLGYPPPPGDRGAGGGDEFDVYILELGRSFYGQTIFEDVVIPRNPNSVYTSFIEIDNDYSGFFSRGLSGLKVTAAHEFHHAIQVGNYGFWEEDSYYYEITSTWMEDVVFDEVNDYYQYLTSYFNNLATPFNSSNGSVEYGRAVWGKFIEKRFGRDLMRRSWEYINRMRSLPAIDGALQERGTNFVREYAEFSLWHFYTGPKADTAKYFSEGKYYPSVRIADNVSFVPPTAFISSTARSLSMLFHRLLLAKTTGATDTVTIALSNLNMEAAQRGDAQAYSFSYRITTEATDATYAFLKNGLKYKLIVNDPQNWKTIAFFNTNVNIEGDTSPYPNPFISGSSGGVAFPLDGDDQVKATLNIYTTSLELVCSRVAESRSQFGKQVIFWDGRDSRGNFVSSGIYIYRISLPSREVKGKLAVVKK